MLIPFTMHARRTRAYSSTLYILHTFQHVSQNMLEVCGWSSFQVPQLSRYSPPRRYVFTSPFTQAVLVSWVANQKGRSRWNWFWLGMLYSFIPLIALAALPSVPDAEDTSQAD